MDQVLLNEETRTLSCLVISCRILLCVKGSFSTNKILFLDLISDLESSTVNFVVTYDPITIRITFQVFFEFWRLYNEAPYFRSRYDLVRHVIVVFEPLQKFDFVFELQARCHNGRA